PNYLAYTLTIGLPISWYLFRMRFHPKLNLLYLAVGIFSIILTSSRTAFIGVAIFAIFLLWQLLTTKFKYKKTLIVFIVIVSVFAYSKIPQQSIDRLMTTGTEISSGDLNNRGAIWSASYDVLKETNPLIGTGIGSFSTEINNYYVAAVSAHNAFISIGVETGFLGLLLFLLILLMCFVMIRKLNRPDKWMWATAVVMWLVFSNMANIQDEKMT